jgi:methyl-accepting chemotaxis protein
LRVDDCHARGEGLREDGRDVRQTIAAFVASNAGVVAVDNAGLPADQQDWSALQAFVESASEDSEISDLTVVDANNIVRAASDPRQIGNDLRVAANERPIAGGEAAGVSYTAKSPARACALCARSITLGDSYGKVDLVVRTGALSAAARTPALLVLLSLVVMLTVNIVGYLSGAAVTRPLARLRSAINEAATSRFALRISHQRGDEFGDAFDAFNIAAAAAEAGLANAPQDLEASMLATRIAGADEQSADVRRVA